MKQPCAYCGKTDTPRHRGHVIPKSLYPSTTPSHIQRPTVPECEECKGLWTEAETQFRNVLTISGKSNAAVEEKWHTVERSFSKPSGKKWLDDLWDAMSPVETGDGTRYQVFPHNEPKVNLVLRKIVRGLAAFHGIAEVVPDEHVIVSHAATLPGSARDRMLQFSLGDDFVQYGFALFDDTIDIDCFILLRLYESREFIGIVSRSHLMRAEFLQKIECPL